jgi:Leucine-rich repeat (LRR) protein
MEGNNLQGESRAPDGCDPDDYRVIEELSKLWSSSNIEITRFSYGFCMPTGDDDATNDEFNGDRSGRTGRVSYLRIDSYHPQTVPPAIGKLSSLKQLSLEATNIETLPSEVGNLVHLVDLNLVGCTSLRTLPEELGNCSSSLERISLPNSHLLRELPSSIGKLKKLRVLSIDISSLKSIPESFVNLGKLTDLILSASNPTSSNLESFALSLAMVLPSSLESLAISMSLLLLLPEEFLKQCKVKTLRLEWDINESTPQNVAKEAMKKFGAFKTVDCLWIEAPKKDDFGQMTDNPSMPGVSSTLMRELVAILPNLRDLLIEGSQHCSFQLDLYEILRVCDKLEELHVKSCRLFTHTSSSEDSLKRMDLHLPRLRILGLESTTGLYSEPSRYSSRDLLSKLHLPNLGILKICRDKGLDGTTLEFLCQDLLERCPSLMVMDFRECSVSQMSRKTVCSLPPKLREFNLTGNPLLSECRWEPSKNLWQLVTHCSQLGFVGVPNQGDSSDRTDDYGNEITINQASFGLHLAVNRARSKVLLNQQVPLSTWSLVLEAAYFAFHDDDDEADAYRNTPWDGVPSEPDGIFHLLTNRGVADIFSAQRPR